MMLFANSTWFEFKLVHAEENADNLSVYEFSGTERVSTPYEFTVELVSRSSDLNLTGYLGAEALLTFADRSGERRLLHGVIRNMEQMHTSNEFTHYRCILVPRLWFLGQTQDHHIYQHKTVEQIVTTVLKKHNFLSEAYSFKLRNSYPEREYCVQYGESDLHFISRICEEEGIFFYFEHTKTGHCLCFSDAPGGPAIPGENLLRYFRGSGNVADTAVVSKLNLHNLINSDISSYKEWNFTKPTMDLSVQDKEPEWEKAPVPQGMELETYQFPHLYQTRTEGDRYVKLQLLRQLTFRQWIECEADISRFLPGFTFTLFSHPRGDVNRKWWVVSVHHKGEQPGVLEGESPEGRGLWYQSSITAIPDDVCFVPELEHKKVRIEGLQSAIVTGPGNEEVFPDKYGRVIVQFHWDRLGQNNEKSTCWVRVADVWAGDGFGSIQIPRIGQEVLVEFMEGDPDRPVITGRVYNELRMPPWQLPSQKTLSGIQSREFKAGRRNQLVLDDTQGQIQAQLSSDHGLSQLNLGYITRINHNEGRKDFRGEGFELRTDNWGVIRAAKGLYISTDKRDSAQYHHKDLEEATSGLEAASQQHRDMVNLAEAHNAQTPDKDGDIVSSALIEQSNQIKGTGQAHKEMTEPQLVLSSPAGIALTTPKNLHLHTGNNIGATTGKHFSLTAGRSFFASALDKISLFAHKMGIKIFAARGKLEIQAQSDDLEIIADKVLKIISAKESVQISAPKEILLTSGGSYIKINTGGIEQGTSKRWVAHAASHTFDGPDSIFNNFIFAHKNASGVCEICEAAKKA
ncbi:type VI secretion system Vgr family protein [Desulfovibrio litoralis]|uniref:Type VI secretion system secreted protein VgrG n=1 Tax=Desulfovibrio litoralis DSM 11393 TaxID=1121455 RepID=A0A1M7TNU4_9BACT|nr:type VI secretion system Vgr family protein [Desulfovibrio litoralis]SHN72424.1 type VI secretion system secreted protein VgrG [Desulfovibrio litoralis DSM 11393]